MSKNEENEEPNKLKIDLINGVQIVDCRGINGRAPSQSNIAITKLIDFAKESSNAKELKTVINVSGVDVNNNDFQRLCFFLCYGNDRFTNLSKIDLSGNSITDARPLAYNLQVGKLSQLRELVLYDNKIKDECIIAFMKALEWGIQRNMSITLGLYTTLKEAVEYINKLVECVTAYQKTNTETNWSSEYIQTDKKTQLQFAKRQEDIKNEYFVGLFENLDSTLYKKSLFINTKLEQGVFPSIKDIDDLTAIGDINSFLEGEGVQDHSCAIL